MKTVRTLFHGALFAVLALLPAHGGVQYPAGELIRLPDGTFYGTSSDGGTFSHGTIFRVTPDSEVTLLTSFSGDTGAAKGSRPRAGLVRDNAGQLWGTTFQGGNFGMGTVFRFNPATRAVSTIVEFAGADGAHPAAALIIDPTGNLWGTTTRGGSSDQGTMFRIEAGTNALSTLVHFTGAAGAAPGTEPKGALHRDAGGILWGTTSGGGALNLGTLFKYDPAGPAFTKVLEFSGTNGATKGSAPVVAMIDGGGGLLWGTTDRGGASDLGTVFKFNPADSTLTTVVDFNSGNGQYPRGRLFADGLGFVHGTASGGGVFSQGTIFKVNVATGALTTVTDLTGTSGLAKGSFPLGGLAPDNGGGLWGTASQGGREDLGTIFRVDRVSGLFVLLAEPNPSPSPPSATVKPPAGNTTTGPAGDPVILSGTARDNVELLQVLVSINGGPFVPATLIPPAKEGAPFGWQISVIPENGANVVIVKSIDSGGDSSKPLTLFFNYTVVRGDIAGSYNGLVEPDPASTAPLLHSGSFTLKALPNGRFTGKLTLGGKVPVVPLVGAFGNDGTLRFGKNGLTELLLVRKNLPILALSMKVDVDLPLTRRITGTLSENGVVVGTILGDQSLYTARKNPVPPLLNVPASLLNPATDKGAYTAALLALVQPLPATDYAQGDGYALGKVQPTGIARFAGKLADGTPFTASAPLSPDNVMPFYAKVYGGAGAVSAFVAFRDLPGQSDADADGMRWFKPANPKGPSYRAGWPHGILVEFAASKFVAPKISGTTLLGNPPGASNAVLQLTSATMPALTNEISIPATGPIVIGGAPTGATPANQLRVTLLATGMLTGSFSDPLNQKVTPFTGVVRQKAQAASGYFLANPPTGQPASTPKISGLIEISAQ